MSDRFTEMFDKIKAASTHPIDVETLERVINTELQELLKNER